MRVVPVVLVLRLALAVPVVPAVLVSPVAPVTLAVEVGALTGNHREEPARGTLMRTPPEELS